jgi:urease gamma subunit
MTQCPLAFHTCRFEQDVVLHQADTADLNFTSCTLLSLYGDWCNSSASLHLTETCLRQMSFGGASFPGSVELLQVRLINPKGSTLVADAMSASAVFLRNTQIEGTVRLFGADITRGFNCSDGTRLINPGGDALVADSMNASSVFLSDTHVEGKVRLLLAEISGELSCRNDTKLINPGGDALIADSMSASNVFLSDTHVEGTVALVSAEISGQLSCADGTKLINPDGAALFAEACKVGRMLYFHLGEAAVGGVNLAYAQVGTLADDLASWPDTYNLVGFTYLSISGDENLDQRLCWIKESKPFSPHVYSQLAEVYRRSGHEGYARQEVIRREKERRQQPDLNWGSRA